MIQLIGLGIALAVFLVLWIIKTAKDGNYSSPFGDSGAELARAFSILLAFMVGVRLIKYSQAWLILNVPFYDY